MKRLIYRYLYNNYYWHNNSLWSGPNDWTTIEWISKDIAKIFALTIKETKWYLKSWCRYSNRNFNFNKEWGYKWANSVTINGETRRLRTTWTPELAQDIHAYHSIDAEAELTALLQEQINREILNNVLANYQQ